MSASLTLEESQEYLVLKELEEKLKCEASLAQFTRSAWHIIEPGTKLTWNWHLETICGYLMAFHHGELPDKRLIINVPPGTLKSILVSVMYPAWTWIDEPELRYLSITNEQGLSIRDALRMKQIVTSEWFQSKWSLPLRVDQNEKTLYANDKNGFRQSQGITASNTGKRGDCLLLDDLIDAKHAFSDVIRQGVNDTWDQSLSSRLNHLEESGVLLIMQRLHESDITGHLLKKVKSHWTVLSIPMRYEGHPTFDAGKDIGRPELNDPRTKKGELLFPKRFSERSVQSLEEDLGEYGTSGQLQQRPVPAGGGIIKKHWWRVWPDDIKLPICDHIFHSWDTAFSEADMKTAAFSACTRWGIFWHEERQRYCILALGMWFERLGYDALRTKLKELDKKFNPDANLIEKKSTGISLIQDMKRASPGRVRSYSPGKGEDKISRAHSVSPMFQSGLIYVPNKDWALGNGRDKLGLIDYVAQFPNGGPPSPDLCFVAGTLIATKRGNIPIEFVTTDDFAFTPYGWRKVINSFYTGEREVISNIGLVGTKNHPIFTFDKGYITLDTITQANSLLRLNVCDLIKIMFHEKSNLMASHTQEYRKKVNTLLEEENGMRKQKDFTLRYGNITIIQRFSLVMRLTISMVMSIITILVTLSAYRLKCIDHYLKRIGILTKQNRYLSKLGRLLRYGISQKKVELGIERTQKQAYACQKQEQNLSKPEIQLKELNCVYGVDQSSNLKAHESNFVGLNVKDRKADGEEESINSVTHTMRPVYNLTVDDAHCYFANGILVHNCDTVTQALIYLRAGNWAGDHPDDKEDVVEHILSEEQDEDTQPERRSYYG